jgi:copper chaperone CopZ
MKHIILSLTFLFFSFSFVQAQSRNVESVDILTSAICEMCKDAIEYDLIYEKGVKTADLDLESKVITVTYNPKKTSPETIRKRISLTGYHADSILRDKEAYEKLPACCKDGGHDDH